MPARSYAHCGSSRPLLGETIGECLDRIAAQLPDNDCVVSRPQGLRFSYADKIPRYWKVVDEFPMTVTGKVQKFKLREMAERELEAGTLPQATRRGKPAAAH